jgi:nucleoside-diphosphate kinase
MEERYAFLAEWYDPNASLIRKYQLLCYPKDNSCEMYDIKNRRPFLKRSVIENLKLDEIFIGSVVNIHSRQLSIVDFGDEFTAKKLKSKKEKTIAVIKPDCVDKMGEILRMASAAELRICNARMVQLSVSEAQELYQNALGKPLSGDSARFMASGPVLALELTGESAVSKWLALLGPDNSAQARRDAPETIRARFGTDGVKNVCHGSTSSADAQRESEFFFGPKPRGKSPATCNNSTLCIVKPHAVLSGKTGDIISAIKEGGFEITALGLYYVEKANAEEFYEVYKGVVAEYSGMVQELCSGPCIAMEIKGNDIHTSFRAYAGPADPEIARHLRPHTLRAKFGTDRIQNAVHCTDLPDDCPLEVEYFFRIISS